MLRRALTYAGAAALLVAIATGLWLYRDYQEFLGSPVHARDEPIVFTLGRGTSYQELVRELRRLGVRGPEFYWRLLGWRKNAGQRIQAGEYAIRAEQTPASLLDDLMHGRVLEYAFTIVEGWTFRDLLAALARQKPLVRELEDVAPEEVMARLGFPDEHPEGRFLPETYHFPRGTTDVALLRRACRAMDEVLEQVWVERDPGLPYESPYEVLIMASIIEKETAVPAERRRIAGVFVRRLKRGMRLQTDPSVIYGLGERYSGNIQRSHLREDTPYNTYTRGGLPPTPIALPGRASLEAAVHPAAGTELYFVSRGDGTHVFSDTLEEHNRAVARYQLGKDGGSR